MAETGIRKIQATSLTERLAALREHEMYDRVAAAPLIVWYGICFAARFPDLWRQVMHADWAGVDVVAMASIASKTATLIFITVIIVLLAMRHTPRARTPGLLPRLAAIAGTYLSVGMVLLRPAELSLPLNLTATFLILGGTVFALYSALNLGRSLSMLPEARRLVTRGPYKIIRHPLYLGEALALIGLTLQFMSPWAVLIFGLQCASQIMRMSSEEKILSTVFPEYRNYMTQTSRLVPYVY